MTRIVSVRERNGLYRIRTADGKLWATRNTWLASLATRFQASSEPVELHGRTGWFYADLRAITPQNATERAQ